MGLQIIPSISLKLLITYFFAFSCWFSCQNILAERSGRGLKFLAYCGASIVTLVIELGSNRKKNCQKVDFLLNAMMQVST